MDERQITQVREVTGTPEREVIRDTVAQQSGTPGERGARVAGLIVYYILGIIEVFLVLRLVLKLLGANPDSGFTRLVYNLSDVFMAPFFGIFSPTNTPGAEVNGVFDPGILIAMAVYALVAWGIHYLISVIMAQKPPEELQA